MNISGRNVNNNLQNSANQNRTSCSDSAMDRAELMKKIQELSFAKTETELYLDGHPEAAPALEYYKELIKKLDALIEEYEAKYGPVTAKGNVGESWDWALGKWPWQYGAEEDV